MARRFLLLLSFVLIVATGAAGQDTAVESPAVTYPGLSEVVPRAVQLANQAGEAEKRLQALADTAALQAQLQLQQQRYADFSARLASYGPSENWYYDRQLEVISQLKSINAALGKLLQRISGQLQEIGQLDNDWRERQNYWSNWQRKLLDEKVKLPRDVFEQAHQQLAATLKLAEKSSQPLVAVQQQGFALQQKIESEINQFEAALGQLRKNLFRRNGHPLYSPRYWAQFTPELWATAQQNAVVGLQLREEFFSKNALLIGVQLLCALGLPLVIYRYRSTLTLLSRWQVFSEHPWATGLFAAVALFAAFYQDMPALFRLLLASCGLLTAVQLCAGLLASRSSKVYLYSFALISLLSLTLRLLGTPLPYYRLYLSVLGLVVLVMLYVLQRQLQAGSHRKLLFLLRLIGALVLAAFVTNVTGYVSLALRLQESTLESTVVVLFAALVYQLGLGGMAFFWTLISSDRSSVVSRFGLAFQRRFERGFWLFLCGYVCLYLTLIWGIYSSIGEVWQALTGLSLQFANYRLSIATVLQVLLVFYLSLELSWLLQIVLDRQLLDRRQYDRGVRDAVKRLLHYFLVLIGFLLAISLAGFELRNFMVLAGAFGIGIGFGLQDIVNNFISGIILLFERPIKVGDGVLIDGEYGTVSHIGLRSTVVETLDQSELIVPNSQLISQKMTNWTHSTRRVRILLPIGVAYGSNLELVMEILQEAGTEHPDVLDNPPPSPIFVGFGDSSLDFELRVWISDIDKRPRVKSEVLLFIDRRFREAGVEIPFPQRDLHLRSVAPGLFPIPGADPDSS